MSRVKQPRQKRRPERPEGQPDEVIQLPFGYMARFGRFLTAKATLSPDQHAQAVDGLLASEENQRREQSQRRERLIEILGKVDSIDLVARASLTYLHFDPDTYKEWESDRSPAHVEYLALQALGAGPSTPVGANPLEASRLTFEALDIVRALFKSASYLSVLDGIKARRQNPNDPTVEYMVKTRLESLVVRGTGYSEHLARVLQGCLGPFDRECRDLLGFTGSQALALTHGMADLISDRLEPRWKEAATGHAETLRAWKRARKHRDKGDPLFPKWVLDLPIASARQHIGFLVSSWLFADTRSLALVTPEELASHCSLEVAACRAFLNAFTCTRELFQPEHHSFPGGAHPLTIQPILHTEGGYLLPVPSTMAEAIRPRMEDLLRQHPETWERYVELRGRYLEQEATTLLAQALPGSTSWRRIVWRATSDDGDLDGLVAADDLAMRIQCKAGRLTAPARRGARERMRRDIGELIEDSARQHLALDTALKAGSAGSIGLSDAQANALKAPMQLEVIVCLDDVGVWATEAHELRKLGVLPADRQVPWVLSLTDLMVVTDLLYGSEFVHYLLRRQRLERDGRMMAHDELDWVGHYIAEGLYFDRYFEGARPPQAFRLLSYTEPIDAWYLTREGLRTVEAPKPTRQLPPHLGKLIRRLEEERPPHWIMAAMGLIDGDEKSREMWNRAIKHALARVPNLGWSNASQIFDGRLGVTLYIDVRTPGAAVRLRVSDYCQKKAEECDQANWIGIGEGATGGLIVVLVERKPPPSLAEVFLDPPRNSAPGAVEK